MKVVWIAGAAFAAAAAAWFGASSDNQVEVRLTNRVQVSGVQRLGVNLGGWSFWGADQFSSNIVKNPGFEGLIDGAIAIPAHAGQGAFDDAPNWLARPGAFWEGARFSIRSGPDAGREGTIVHSSQSNIWGLPSFVACDGDAIPGPGDAVALVRVSETGLPTQWWYSRDPGNAFAPELNQVRPGSPGTRSLRVSAGGSAAATLASYFDSIGPRAGKLLPLSGAWNLSFWARLDKGAAALHVAVGRQGSPEFLSRDVPLSSSWSHIQLSFVAYDDGPVGTAHLLFQVTGQPFGEVLLDDVDLRRAADAGEPFRHEVVSALERLHPSYLRDWQGQLGDTMANRIAPPFARKSYRYRPGDEAQSDYGYGLDEFLDLCRRIDASPWIVVPTTFADGDCAAMGDHLSSRANVAKFPEILLEFGNENWNSIFRPAGIPDPIAHGQAADRCFNAIRQHAPQLPIKTIVNAQAAIPATAIRFGRGSGASDILAVAPYFLYSLPSGLSLNRRIAMLSPPDDGNLRKIAGANPPLTQELAVYEVNLHTVEGSASSDERRPVVAGIASGSALAKTMMNALARGIRRQCAYSLTGFDSQLSAQPGYVPLWGMARDLGPTQRFRPTGLALQLLNEAVGGDMISIGQHGSSEVAAYGFRSSRAWSAVFVSSAFDARNVTVVLPAEARAPATLTVRQLVADTLEATNEDNEGVTIGEQTIAVTGSRASFVLRPWSVAILVPGAAR